MWEPKISSFFTFVQDNSKAWFIELISLPVDRAKTTLCVTLWLHTHLASSPSCPLPPTHYFHSFPWEFPYKCLLTDLRIFPKKPLLWNLYYTAMGTQRRVWLSQFGESAKTYTKEANFWSWKISRGPQRWTSGKKSISGRGNCTHKNIGIGKQGKVKGWVKK